VSEGREIGLAEAAQKLKIPYQDYHRLLLTGLLRGEKRRGRWYVLAEDVSQLAEGLPTRPVRCGDGLASRGRNGTTTREALVTATREPAKGAGRWG
jgi:hypothetical protein